MSPQYYWIAASITSTAMYFVLNTAFLLKHPHISIHYSLAITHAIAAALLFSCLGESLQSIVLTGTLVKSLMMVALLTWLAKILYFYAYKRTSVANVTVFSALTPLYAAFISSLMGVPLSYQQITGIAIITGSIALYFGKDQLLDNKLRISAPSLAIICAFASTVPTAISTYFQKDAIALSTPLFISFFICAFSAAASFAYLLASGNKTFPALTVKSFLPLAMIALLQAIAALSFSAYVAQGHPAIAQALQRLSSLLQILLAHLFLRQRFNTPWHLLCVGFSVFGLMILFST